jgi:hypothetical protein
VRRTEHGAGAEVSSSTWLKAAGRLVSRSRRPPEAEGALAVQMAQVHALTADLLGRARQTDRTDHVALYGNLAVKLARTFAMQAEALHRIRGGLHTKEVRVLRRLVGGGTRPVLESD